MIKGLSIKFIGTVLEVPSRTVRLVYNSTLPNSGHYTTLKLFNNTRRLDGMAASLGINKPRILVDPLGPPPYSLGKAVLRLAIRSDFIKPLRILYVLR